jgi:ubiquitin-protein ligase
MMMMSLSLSLCWHLFLSSSFLFSFLFFGKRRRRQTRQRQFCVSSSFFSLSQPHLSLVVMRRAHNNTTIMNLATFNPSEFSAIEADTMPSFHNGIRRRLTREMKEKWAHSSTNFLIKYGEDNGKGIFIVLIRGIRSGPYEKCSLPAEIHFPKDYPFKGPKILFHGIVLHPLLYNKTDTSEFCGCIFQDAWSPHWTSYDLVEVVVDFFEKCMSFDDFGDCTFTKGGCINQKFLSSNPPDPHSFFDRAKEAGQQITGEAFVKYYESLPTWFRRESFFIFLCGHFRRTCCDVTTPLLSGPIERVFEDHFLSKVIASYL